MYVQHRENVMSKVLFGRCRFRPFRMNVCVRVFGCANRRRRRRYNLRFVPNESSPFFLNDDRIYV